MKIVVVAFLLLVGGSFMMYGRVSDLAVMNRMESEGVKANGTPIDTYERRSKAGTPTYYVKFEYQTDVGKQSASLTVPEEYYDSIKADTKMKIRYLRDDPAKVMIEGHPLASLKWVLIDFVTWILLTAVCCFLAYRYFRN